MPVPQSEPDSAETIASWIGERVSAHDRFRPVFDASERHRLEHGLECTVYATGGGPVLGTLAAATGAKRILELGCGLGYSALWLAFGSPDGRVETIECDPAHAGRRCTWVPVLIGPLLIRLRDGTKEPTVA